ncbi:MAG: STAS domain-containing protein [Actinomycetota bacterium]|nr:STAS domain-containing protein [Actinomycetota bacterium]
MSLTTSVLYDGSVAVIVLEGELDLAVTAPLDQAVAAALTDGFLSLVLDVALLTFCDSCGLGSIMRAHRTVAARGGRLTVAGAQGAFARLVEVTALDTVLTLVGDVSEALVSAQPRRAPAPGPSPETEA